MSGEGGRRDEPDDRPRCKACRGLGEPTNDYERDRTKCDRYCKPCDRYFGAVPDESEQP